MFDQKCIILYIYPFQTYSARYVVSMNSMVTFNIIILLDLQWDRRNPGQACDICEKSVMREHFDDIAEASPTAKAQLKTQYGLPDNPSPE